jgi:hypothetical protein
VFIQEATAILFCKDASETPWFIWQRLYVLNVNEKQISWLGGLDLEGAGQIMNTGEIYIAHVVRGIIVLDLAFSMSDSICSRLLQPGDTDLQSNLRIGF